MITGAALGQLGEHLPQRCLAEAAHGLGRELQLAVGALEIPLTLKLALDLPQRLHVVHGLPAERAADRLFVHIVEARTWVVLPERILQVSQVGKLRERGRGVAQAKRVAAGHAGLRHAGVDVWPPGPERVAEP